MSKSTIVTEGWSGPGRSDVNIVPLAIAEDCLHIDISKKGSYEWWYFDAHFTNDYMFVVFFHASNPNPGLTQGKPGIEIIILRPDGNRIQKFFPVKKIDFSAKKDFPEVTIDSNTLRVEAQANGLPIYTLNVLEANLGCQLTYRSEVNGWKPGNGSSQFGPKKSFSWIIPMARASVEGEIIDEGNHIKVSGIGYHDHNWLNFSFERIIKYWMWGRIYSEHFTVSYAFIQCNKSVGNHQVKVLMVAKDKEAVVSTGEFDFNHDQFTRNDVIGYSFPKNVTITAKDNLTISMKVDRILEAQNMLDNFNPIIRFVAKNLLRIKPDYLRVKSNFDLSIAQGGVSSKETGSMLHEIVIFKPIQEDTK